MLVDCIKEQRATYVTNSMANALKLVRKGCKVFLPGGEIKNSTEAIVGADAIDYRGRDRLSPQTAFYDRIFRNERHFPGSRIYDAGSERGHDQALSDRALEEKVYFE